MAMDQKMLLEFMLATTTGNQKELKTHFILVYLI